MSDYSIMIVDYSDFARKLTTELLTNVGYSVVTARNGIDAILHADFHTVNIIIMALEMPFLNGFDTAHIIRNHLAMLDYPILIGFTSNAMCIEKAEQSGMDDILLKISPFKENLLNKIKKWDNVLKGRELVRKFNEHARNIPFNKSLPLD